MTDFVRFENYDGQDVFIDPEVVCVVRPGGVGRTVIESWPRKQHAGSVIPAPVIVRGEPWAVMAALGIGWRNTSGKTGPE